MKVRPLGDRIIAKRVEKEEKTRGGIVIPDSAKEKPLEARAIAVGAGRRQDDGTTRKLEVKVGDTILIGKYSGTEITIDSEDFIILREDDVLGIIER